MNIRTASEIATSIAIRMWRDNLGDISSLAPYEKSLVQLNFKGIDTSLLFKHHAEFYESLCDISGHDVDDTKAITKEKLIPLKGALMEHITRPIELAMLVAMDGFFGCDIKVHRSFRMGDGVKSEMFHVLDVCDSNKRRTVIRLADHLLYGDDPLLYILNHFSKETRNG